ncbi:hypothetical protein LZ32DRAFT_48355 [Colletotrichum eremochloae]|nr:hypothetical protein LZ32DRAFT_48355 [Colletotrichum eremochloae]
MSLHPLPFTEQTTRVHVYLCVCVCVCCCVPGRYGGADRREPRWWGRYPLVPDSRRDDNGGTPPPTLRSSILIRQNPDLSRTAECRGAAPYRLFVRLAIRHFQTAAQCERDGAHDLGGCFTTPCRSDSESWGGFQEFGVNSFPGAAAPLAGNNGTTPTGQLRRCTAPIVSHRLVKGRGSCLLVGCPRQHWPGCF